MLVEIKNVGGTFSRYSGYNTALKREIAEEKAKKIFPNTIATMDDLSIELN